MFFVLFFISKPFSFSEKMPSYWFLNQTRCGLVSHTLPSWRKRTLPAIKAWPAGSSGATRLGQPCHWSPRQHRPCQSSSTCHQRGISSRRTVACLALRPQLSAAPGKSSRLPLAPPGSGPPTAPASANPWQLLPHLRSGSCSPLSRRPARIWSVCLFLLSLADAARMHLF